MLPPPNRFILKAMRYITLLLFICLSFPALAQEREQQIYAPGSSYKNEAGETIRRLQRESFEQQGYIKPETIEVSLVQMPYMEGSQFGILMTVPDVVSGCWNVSPLEYETSFIDQYYMDVKVKDYKRTKIEVENVGYECPTENKMTTALIPLDAQDLKNREIRQIRFSSGYVADYYNVKHTENGITLLPQSMVVFRAKELTGERKDRMRLDFGVQGIVTLHVPMAKKGDNIEEALRNFAYRQALSSDPDMPPTVKRDGGVSMTFKDQTGRVKSQIGESGYSLLGEIMVPRPYDGPQGRGLTNVPLQVYVTEAGKQL